MLGRRELQRKKDRAKDPRGEWEGGKKRGEEGEGRKKRRKKKQGRKQTWKKQDFKIVLKEKT